MKIRQFDIWIADLNPRRGTEAGKRRPVVVVQSDLLNAEHNSTIVCPISTHVISEAVLLRVHLKAALTGLKEDCDILIDQVRAIDNRRFVRKVGMVPPYITEQVRENLRIVLDME